MVDKLLFDYPVRELLSKVVAFFFVGMATWRLSSLLAYEPGPFQIFERFRRFLSTSKHKILREISLGVECGWCNSVWIGMVLSFLIAQNVFEWFVVSFSLSVFSIAVNRKLGS